MNRYKRLQINRKAVGLCICCGKFPAELHKTKCTYCLGKLKAEYQAGKLHAGKALCKRCFRRPINFHRSKSCCNHCLDLQLHQAKQYRKNHLDKIKIAEKESCNRRRVKIGKRVLHYTNNEWVNLCIEHNGTCLWCNKKIKLTADHVIPLSKDGLDSIDNIQPLCLSCNSRKGARILDFRPFGSTIMDWT